MKPRKIPSREERVERLDRNLLKLQRLIRYIGKTEPHPDAQRAIPRLHQASEILSRLRINLKTTSIFEKEKKKCTD